MEIDTVSVQRPSANTVAQGNAQSTTSGPRSSLPGTPKITLTLPAGALSAAATVSSAQSLATLLDDSTLPVPEAPAGLPPFKRPRLMAARPVATSFDLYAHQLRLERQPLAPLLHSASKSLNTTDWTRAMADTHAAHVLRLVDVQRERGTWSVRQPRKFRPAPRVPCHWDGMLGEMRWLALDFRQERRWKMAVAAVIAQEAREVVQKRHAEADASLIRPYTPPPLSTMPLFYRAFDADAAKTVDPGDCYAGITALDPRKLRMLEDVDMMPVAVLTRHAVGRVLFAGDRRDEVKAIRLPALSGEGMYLPGVEKERVSGMSEGTRCRHKCITLITAHTNVTVFVSDTPIDIKPSTAFNPIVPSNQKNRPALQWTADEDHQLLSLAALSHNNWTLTADTINSRRSHAFADYNSTKTPWDCAQRAEVLAKNTALAAKVQRGRGDEWKRRAMRHMHFMDGVMKVARKRDAQLAKAQPAQVKSTTSVSAPTGSGDSETTLSAPATTKPKVNLAAHVSHTAIAQRCGVDPKIYRDARALNERRWTKQPTPPAAAAASATMPQQLRSSVTPPARGLLSGAGSSSVAALLQQQQLAQQASMLRQQQAAAAAIASRASTGGSAASPHGPESGTAIAAAGSPASQQQRAPQRPSTASIAATIPGIPPPIVPGNSPMTQQQVAQFLQRQAMLRQSGSPQIQAQELLALTQAQINQMPAVLAQRVMMARQQAQQTMLAQQRAQQAMQASRASGQAGGQQNGAVQPATGAAQAQV